MMISVFMCTHTYLSKCVYICKDTHRFCGKQNDLNDILIPFLDKKIKFYICFCKL